MELKPTTTKRAAAPHRLLIVPYGIETYSDLAQEYSSAPFNRTLWN